MTSQSTRSSRRIRRICDYAATLHHCQDINDFNSGTCQPEVDLASAKLREELLQSTLLQIQVALSKSNYDEASCIHEVLSEINEQMIQPTIARKVNG